MFHANAWGLPYGAAMTGADLLLPGRFTAARVAAGPDRRTSGATIAAAVPTIWLDLLREADEHGADLSSLRTVICGGAAVPLALMQAFEERHGVRILQAWGMTETGPLASLARPPRPPPSGRRRRVALPRHRRPPAAVRRGARRRRGGRGPPPRRRARRRARGARPVGRDRLPRRRRAREVPRRLAADRRRRVDRPARATSASPTARRTSSSRGGEWISSVELEKELIAHPDVLEAAVIAVPDERWTERPLACVVRRAGRRATPPTLRAHLEGRVAKWWLPGRLRVHRRGAQDRHRQVRQEAPARAARRRRARHGRDGRRQAPAGTSSRRLRARKTMSRGVRGSRPVSRRIRSRR